MSLLFILLDGLLEVLNNGASRKKIIEQISHDLRQMAINQGDEIDDIYRNVAGITFQMWYMESAYTDQIKTRSVSKLFINTVDLYQNNLQEYEKILKEARQMVNGKTSVEEAFTNYLASIISPAQLSELFLYYPEIESFCLERGILHDPLFETTDFQTIKNVQQTVNQNKYFKVTHKKKRTKYITAIWYYYLFIKEGLPQREAQNSTVKSDSMSDLLRDKETPTEENPSAYIDTTDSSPKTAQADESKILTDRLRDLLKTEYERTKEGLSLRLIQVNLPDNDNAEIKSILIKASWAKFQHGKYVYVSEIEEIASSKASTAIHEAVIPSGSVSGTPDIHKRSENGTAEPETENLASASAWVPQYTAMVKNVLVNHYPYGFRMGSPIEMMRFRNFAENDALSIPDSEEELEKELAAAGTLIDGKIYTFQDVFLSELSNLLNNVFNSGATAIFYEPFMEKNAEWMEEHHISSAEMLHDVLSSQFSEFAYTKNFMMTGAKKTEKEAIAYEIHRVSDMQDVVYCTVLSELLPYIPSGKITTVLSASDDFVRISEGKYFIMEHFMILDEEIEKIQDFVERECCTKGYASITDLPYGEIPERNFELSDTALYSAVYIAVLKGKYTKSGRLLARGIGIDIDTLLKNYCHEKNSCTLTEVMEYMEELVDMKNQEKSFQALYDTMVRIGQESFVSDSQVDFDVEQIDSILQEMIGDRFAPIKDVATFAMFPSCGQNWNYYLLGSYCYRFSQKYQLCVMNFNRKNVGILADKSLKMDYIDMLAEIAANANIPLTEIDLGLYFEENGLMANSSFRRLPEVLAKAETLREGG